MPEIAKFDLLRLDGGVNQGLPATHIADNEAADTVNFYSWPGQLISRKGLTKISSAAFGESLRGIFAYKKAVGDWILLLMGRTALAKLSGTSIVEVVNIDAVPFVAGDEPPSMRQYKDTVYIVRDGIVDMYRTDGNVVGLSGVPKPITAPVMAEGATGALAAGKYMAVVTFVNKLTGAESDWSPVSNELTIVANKKINWTGIPTSLNYQVNARNLYRTVKDGKGQYFFVARINDNFTTTYEDNVEDKNLGEPASLDNGDVPQNLRAIEIWKERLFGTDGRDVFFSREGFPESFSADFVIQVFPDDGHEVRGLLGLGSSLLVGKTNGTHYLTGSGLNDFELNTLSDKHGVASGASMAGVRSVAFWYGGDDFYMTDGSSIRGIGSPKIQRILESVPEAYRSRVVSFAHPTLKWYVSSIPGEDGVGKKEIVYNYESGAWDIFEHGALGGYSFAGEFANELFGKVLYAVYDDGHLYQWNEGFSDSGAVTTCRWRSKEFGFDKNNMLKSLTELNVLATLLNEPLTLRIYRDGSSTPLMEKVIQLGGGRPWKRTGLNNIRKLGTTLSIEIEYSGAGQLTISGIGFTVAAYSRSTRKI